MALLPDFFKDCVVAIGVLVDNNKGEKQKVYIGTGFLVGYCINAEEEPKKRKYEIYLITNRHVVDKKEKILVKFNRKKEKVETKDYEIKLIENNNMLYSCCNIDDVDIVAIQIDPNILINDESAFAFFSLDAHAMTVQQMQEKGIAEGDFVYTLGYPMNLVNQIKNVPICRLGCISYISTILKYGIPDKNYIIDSQSFPGNSGGPVIIRPEALALNGTKAIPSAALIGILHSYIPYKDSCISLQTGEVTQIHQENSGLTLVHPVDLIIRTIEIERKRIKTIQSNEQPEEN